MKDYKDVTYLELLQKEKEMLNDFGRVYGHCAGVSCKACPLSSYTTGAVECSQFKVEHPEEYIKIVMEYEPLVDWSKVPVDTKIQVKWEEGSWKNRHFAKYKDGKVYAWDSGKTSFTVDNIDKDLVSWNFARLYKEDNE